MNIVTISQMIGVQSLNQLDSGTIIVKRFNQLINDPKYEITLDFTGDQLYARYSELPPATRLSINEVDILDNKEAVDLATDLVTITRHAQILAEKDDTMKNGFFGWIGVASLLATSLVVCAYLLHMNDTVGINDTRVTRLVVSTVKWAAGKAMGETSDASDALSEGP